VKKHAETLPNLRAKSDWWWWQPDPIELINRSCFVVLKQFLLTMTTAKNLRNRIGCYLKSTVEGYTLHMYGVFSESHGLFFFVCRPEEHGMPHEAQLRIPPP